MMDKKVDATDIQIGMFISQLDRPWTDTPFMLQGFLVETDEDLAQVRDYCQHVYIDLGKSIGREYEYEAALARKLSALAEGPRVVTVVRPRDLRYHAEELNDTAVLPDRRKTNAGPTTGTHRRKTDARCPTNAPSTSNDLRWQNGISEEEEALLGDGKERGEERAADRISVKEARVRVRAEMERRRGAKGSGGGFGLGWLSGALDWFKREDTERFNDRFDNIKPDRPKRQDDGPIVVYREVETIADEIPRARETIMRSEEVIKQIVTEVESSGVVHIEKAHEVVNEMVDSMTRNPNAMIWLSRLRTADHYAYAQSLQTAIYMVALGLHIGIARQELTHLSVAGLMLDVGKLRVPKELLEKPGKLTEVEFAAVKRHVDHSLAILDESTGVHQRVLDAVGRHHEREDGGGYPHGLKSEAIGIYGRIAGIVDTFVALTNVRPYANTLSMHEALRSLYRWRGKLFHEPLVEQFVQAIGVFPVGSMVELTSGDVAVVLQHNRVRRLKPRVLLLTGPDKSALTKPVPLDLLYAPVGGNGAEITIAHALPAGAYGIDPREFYLQ